MYSGKKERGGWGRGRDGEHNLSDEFREVRNRMVLAFRGLRKHKITTRMNFSCCGSCASGEIHEIAEKQKAEGTAFWCRQSEGHFWDDGMVYVNYYGMKKFKGRNKEEKEEAETERIGKIVADALRGEGLEVEWDGDHSQSIYMKGFSKEALHKYQFQNGLRDNYGIKVENRK